MKFTRPLLITKLKATGVHLSMSIVVFIYLAYQIYYNWYPQPYFEVDGGWQGIRLIGAVDLVLGPLITFLIFDLSKKRKDILFDLAIILVIQFAALAYGIYATYTQRPVSIVLIDEFVVSSTMEHYAGTLSSSDELKRYSDEKPPIIFADFPMTQEGVDEAQRIKVETGVLENAQMGLYQPQSQLKFALRFHQPRVRKLLDEKGPKQEFEDWLKANAKNADEVYIERFSGRYGNAWLIFDLDGKYLDYFRKLSN